MKPVSLHHPAAVVVSAQDPQDPQDLQDREYPHACLSALVDGEAESLQAACRLWRDDENARRAWDTYHLIGDVMRSEDLAASPHRAAGFLAGVSARLALEPVVLAPQANVPLRRRRQPWLMPAATAAGIAVVAGVLMVAGVGSPDGSTVAPTIAVVPARGEQVQTVNVDSQGVLRDPRLEELVRQHHAIRGGVAVPLPGAMRPQSVSVER